MPQCDGIKRDGGRCTVVVGPGQSHCYQHDPKRAEDRRRNASKGGRSKGNQKLARLDKQLEDLARDTLQGDVERGVATVVNQIINTRARLIELERKIKETDELQTRLEALEDVLKRRRAG
jgi:septal ring factor EnvC (AmiA/AmiB activator)